MLPVWPASICMKLLSGVTSQTLSRADVDEADLQQRRLLQIGHAYRAFGAAPPQPLVASLSTAG